MSAEDNKTVARRFVQEIWGNGNLEAARDLLSPDLINHSARPGQRQGLGGFLETLEVFHRAFPTRRFVPDRLVAQGDEVQDSWTMIAFHEGEFFGVAPTGQLVTLTGADWLHVEDGRISEIWHEQDVFGVLMELNGILP